MVLSDLFRTMPGFRVEWDGTEQGYKIVPTRSQQGQTRCINYFIDRAPWTPMDDQDLDKTFGVNEIAGDRKPMPARWRPAEFQRPGGMHHGRDLDAGQGRYAGALRFAEVPYHGAQHRASILALSPIMTSVMVSGSSCA